MIVTSIFLIALVFLSWLACVYIDYKDKNPFFFLWMLLILFVYIPLLVNFNMAVIDIEITNSILFFSFLSQTTYVFSSIFFLGLFNKGVIRLNRKEISINNLGKLPIYTMYLGSLFVFIIFLINGIGYSELMSATFLTKREIGSSSLFILIVSAVVLAQSYFIFKSKSLIHISYYLFFFAVVILFYKSRSIIILGLLPLLYYLLFLSKSKKYLIFIALVAPIILLATQFLRALRYQGALVNLDIDRLMEDVSQNMKLLFVEGDFSVINIYFNIIRDCDFVNWCGDFTLIQSIAGLMTTLSGVKTLEYYLYDYYVSPGSNGSLHPTLFGFFYGDFGGYLGFLFFILIGLLRSYISTFVINSKFYFLFIGFAMYFTLFMARGSVYNSFVFMVMALLLLFILNASLFKKRAVT